MAGRMFMFTEPALSADPGQGAPAAAAAGSPGAGSHTEFLIWYVVIGFIVPLLIFTGYRVGGFQFIFRSR